MTTDLLMELEPFVAKALDAHLTSVTDWDPVTDYVPWGEGVDYQERPFDPAQSKLSAPVQAALAVSLAAEDELLGRFADLSRQSGNYGAWNAWLGRWRAEEGRHAIALRIFLGATRGLDPRQTESDRMAALQSGRHAGDKRLLESLVSVTVYELASSVLHANTGRAAQQADKILWLLLQRISRDEDSHHVVFRGLVSAALDIAPSETVEAICNEVMRFAVPGAARIRDFQERTHFIAQAGIYNHSVHTEGVILPLLQHWKIFSLEGLTPWAERKREELAAQLESLRLRAHREPETLAEIAAGRTASTPTGRDRARVALW